MLARNDPDPVISLNEDAAGPVLLTCEHAGRLTPGALGGMGVAAADWDRHIAWDVGALALAKSLSRALDARLIAQRYSRLVIDCNRALIAPDLIPEISDGTTIPGNRDLTAEARAARVEAIHRPYHDCIAASIERRQPLFIFAVHSFTPVMNGAARPWHCGLLANRMPEAAEALLGIAQARAPFLHFALNEPYTVDDISDYTVPVHGERNGIPHALVEIRNDQLQSDEGVAFWSGLLAGAITEWLQG